MTKHNREPGRKGTAPHSRPKVKTSVGSKARHRRSSITGGKKLKR